MVLVCGLVLAPWAFGGVEPQNQALLCAVVLLSGGLCCVVLLASSRVRIGQPPWLWTLLPFFLVLGTGLLQLMPSAWQSAYPAATRMELARLTTAAGAFAVGAALLWQQPLRPLLWAAVSVNGAVLAFFGIAHVMRPEIGFFSYVPTHGGSPFASFVSKNSAAGCLNLSAAAGLGLLVWARHRSRTRAAERGVMPSVDGLQLCAALLVVVCLAGVFSSLSRSGCVAAVGAGLITACAVPGRARLSAIAMFVVLLGLGASLVVWSGRGQDVESRLATLFAADITENGRVAHWQDALQTASHAPVTGSGLGTYRYAYLPFQAGAWKIWFHHAENQYVETLVECGVAGLAALLLMLGLVGYCLRRLYRRGPQSTSADIRVAGLFAFCSMAIQSLFDFPLVIPSSMLLFAVICGAITGTAFRAKRQHQRNEPESSRFRRLIPLWATALFLLWGIVGLYELRTVAQVTASRDAISDSLTRQPEADSVETQVAELEFHLQSLRQAAEQRPDDAELQQHIADLYVALYRIQAFQSYLSSAVGAADDAAGRRNAWRRTEPAALYAVANQAYQIGRSDVLARMQGDEIVAGHLRPAVFHLQQALRSCALLPRVNLDLASLAFLHQDTPDGVLHLERECELSQANADVMYSVGVNAWAAGLTDLAQRALRRSLQLESTHLNEVVDLLLSSGADAEQLMATLPDSPALLVETVDSRFGAAEFTSQRLLLLERARALLKLNTERGSEWHQQYAQVCAASKQSDEAVAAWRQAIRLDPSQPRVRLDLSRYLRDQGRVDEAREEVRACARLFPERDDVQAMIRSLERSADRHAGRG